MPTERRQRITSGLAFFKDANEVDTDPVTVTCGFTWTGAEVDPECSEDFGFVLHEQPIPISTLIDAAANDSQLIILVPSKRSLPNNKVVFIIKADHLLPCAAAPYFVPLRQ